MQGRTSFTILWKITSVSVGFTVRIDINKYVTCYNVYSLLLIKTYVWTKVKEI